MKDQVLADDWLLIFTLPEKCTCMSIKDLENLRNFMIWKSPSLYYELSATSMELFGDVAPIFFYNFNVGQSSWRLIFKKFLENSMWKR